MPRNMSFALTTEQFKNRTKTVTRRFGWKFLKPGDIVCGAEKAMGLKKGEKIERLGLIRIKTVRTETLCAITKGDCIREGFPHFEPEDFVKMICDHYKCDECDDINRIEFDYIADEKEALANKTESKGNRQITKVKKSAKQLEIERQRKALNNIPEAGSWESKNL